MVKEMHETPGSEAILERLMMGTDWFMLTLHNRFGEFVDLYSNAWQKMFGSANTARFEGANALAFLDLDRADSPARRRLEAWYRVLLGSSSPVSSVL